MARKQLFLLSITSFLFPLIFSSDDSLIVKQNSVNNHNSNRLINEKSPYLLQHAYNPVNWFAWGEEAFEIARREDKPIFLSIGYSTCYWCHVMEREVFENDSIAELMNELFVNIKVDREERPDVDRVYMSALQSMTGSGGWPMSMFLTPDLKPFYGGTYIPPSAKYGMTGFEELIAQIDNAWKTRRGELLQAGNSVVEFIQKNTEAQKTESKLGKNILDKGMEQFKNGFDEEYSGFGVAPKFPRPSGFNFLLRFYNGARDKEALTMVVKTLLFMSKGGIHDHLGGGFHRYSVDRFWRVPHFEKMLYDQSQLAVAYIEAYQLTNDKLFAEVARDILSYVSNKLTDEQGGFYSAEDAESLPGWQTGAVEPSKPRDKEEGAYYVWEMAEIEKLLGQKNSDIFCFYYGVGERGNAPAGSDPHNVFINKNILYVDRSLSETVNKFNKSTDEVSRIITESKKILLENREKRPPPHLDDKILVSWNGLMISAFLKAYQALNDESYLNSARRSTDFILANLYDANTNTLLHRYRDGEAKFEGNLDDYAFFTQGLLDLYESTFEEKYLDRAIKLTEAMVLIFYDNEKGGFFDVSGNDKSILIRTKEDYDSAEPTGNSIAIMNLMRVSHFTDNKDLFDKAYKSLLHFSSKMSSQPYAMPQMLCALDYFLHEPKQIIIAGDKTSSLTQEMIREAHRRYLPGKILIFANSHTENKLIPFLSSIVSKSDKTTAYVCENYTCKLPAHDINEFIKQLDDK